MENKKFKFNIELKLSALIIFASAIFLIWIKMVQAPLISDTAAIQGLVGLVILGVLSVSGLIISIKRIAQKRFTWTSLLLMLLSLSVILYYLIYVQNSLN